MRLSQDVKEDTVSRLSVLFSQLLPIVGVSSTGMLPLQRSTSTFPLERSGVGRLGALQREQQWLYALSFGCTSSVQFSSVRQD